MRTIYIVKTGSTFPAIAQDQGDFEDWISAGLCPSTTLPADRPAIQVIHAAGSTLGPLTYPDLARCAGVVLTGSHDMVTDNAPWMQDLAQWLRQVCEADIPVLGICFGHQLLAHTLGGKVGPHPAGLELGTVPVALQADLSDDPLWQHMPPCFDANVVHFQSVRQLPPQARTIAGNSHEACQAFRWRRHVWGVQFHPEFNQAAMQAYITHVQQELAQHGSAWQTRVRCEGTPEAASLLRHFAQYAARLQHAVPEWEHAA